MKGVLLIISLTLSTSCFAQKPEGIWNLKFYMNHKAVSASIKKTWSGTSNLSDTLSDNLSYSNCILDGHKASADLFFRNDSLYQVTTYFLPSKGGDIKKYYDRLRTDLYKKHGRPQDEGHSDTHIAEYWRFPKDDFESKDGEIVLALENRENEHNRNYQRICLIYRDGLISNRLKDETTSHAEPIQVK